jgi:hypothetical protein
VEPVKIVRRLAEARPLHLIVDLNKRGLPAPQDLACADYLFDFLHPLVVSDHSPLVVAPGDTAQLFNLVEQTWGSDSLVCFYTQLDKPSLLNHLRAVARCICPGLDDPGHQRVLGFCWPGILEMLLAHSKPDFARHLLGGIDAFLMEYGDAGSWQLFAQDDFAQTLDNLGFVRVAASLQES